MCSWMLNNGICGKIEGCEYWLIAFADFHSVKSLHRGQFQATNVISTKIPEKFTDQLLPAARRELQHTTAADTPAPRTDLLNKWEN